MRGRSARVSPNKEVVAEVILTDADCGVGVAVAEQTVLAVLAPREVVPAHQ